MIHDPVQPQASSVHHLQRQSLHHNAASCQHFRWTFSQLWKENKTKIYLDHSYTFLLLGIVHHNKALSITALTFTILYSSCLVNTALKRTTTVRVVQYGRPWGKIQQYTFSQMFCHLHCCIKTTLGHAMHGGTHTLDGFGMSCIKSDI